MKKSLLLAGSGAVGLSAIALSITPQTSAVTPVGAAKVETPGLRLPWADFDGDGLRDLLIVHPAGGLALYRNAGDGALEDVTELLGLEMPVAVRSGLWQDFDADGSPDLFLVHASGAGQLLRNEAGARFSDATAAAGLVSAGMLDARWSDYDRDGRPDLVVLATDGYRLHRNLGDGFFEMLSLTPTPDTVPAPLGRLTGQGNADAREPGSDDGEPVVGAAEPDSARRADGARRTAETPRDGGGSAAGSLGNPGVLGGAQGICALTVRDQSGGGCIEASSTPDLGKLVPMSTDLYIDPVSGHVGLGTIAPTAKLHVNGDIAMPRALLGTDSNAAHFEMLNHIGIRTIDMDALGAGAGGSIELTNGSGTPTALLGGQVPLEGAGRLELHQNTGINTIELRAANAGTAAAELNLSTSAGVESVEIVSEEAAGNGAQIALALANGTDTMIFDAEVGTRAAEISLRMRNGQETVELVSEEVPGQGGQIVLRRGDGTATIVLDAEEAGGMGRVITQVLEITGGADLVESFDTTEACEPGSVLVIDPARSGELALATAPYDARVAGIVSGAGGIRPGLHMGQEGVASGDTPVALTGRVYVRCSAENGPVRPGDLLTSSSTPGHAMRATDRERSFGAVLGKAMTSLDEDTGLVLVLIGLQ